MQTPYYSVLLTAFYENLQAFAPPMVASVTEGVRCHLLDEFHVAWFNAVGEGTVHARAAAVALSAFSRLAAMFSTEARAVARSVRAPGQSDAHGAQWVSAPPPALWRTRAA